MTRRTREEIWEALLTGAETPKPISHLMGETHLTNYTQIMKHINQLLDKELLTRDAGTYHTTDKGEKWLLKYRELQQIVKEE